MNLSRVQGRFTNYPHPAANEQYLWLVPTAAPLSARHKLYISSNYTLCPHSYTFSPLRHAHIPKLIFLGVLGSPPGYVGQDCLNICPQMFKSTNFTLTHTHAYPLIPNALQFSLSSPFGIVEEFIRRI